MYIPDLEKWIANILTVTAPIVLLHWKARRKEEKLRKQLLDNLSTVSKFFPPHGHKEDAGPLFVAGITRPPKANSGG